MNIEIVNVLIDKPKKIIFIHFQTFFLIFTQMYLSKLWKAYILTVSVF